MTSESASLPSKEAVDSATRLYNAIHAAFPRAVMNFESRWTEACDLGSDPERSANAGDRTDKFNALKRLGPKIIPFVVFKIASGDPGQNSLGVSLYNTLEKDPDYSPSQEGDLHSSNSRIVEFNYRRNKIFRNSATAVFTECEEYFDLLEMGPSIIANLMVEYYHNEGGYYYELLHEIIHGRKMGAYMVQKPVLYDKCCWFFNVGDHDQAPLYIPTPMDRWIYHGEPMDR